jgi:SAM-dependent methyltransferase
MSGRIAGVDLLDDDRLTGSSVVANNAMNRGRGLTGRDGYGSVLGIDLPSRLAEPIRWLDLCCGQGKALLQAPGHVRITGVDLVDFFAGRAPPNVEFVTAPVAEWQPRERYDLITCVHGLHYVGDKLGLLARAASWLTDGGQFVANFDVAGVRLADGEPAGRGLVAALRAAGFDHDARSHRISRQGPGDVTLPFRYLGADDRAGPNYTGQPAVDSYYASTG